MTSTAGPVARWIIAVACALAASQRRVLFLSAIVKVCLSGICLLQRSPPSGWGRLLIKKEIELPKVNYRVLWLSGDPTCCRCPYHRGREGLQPEPACQLLRTRNRGAGYPDNAILYLKGKGRVKIACLFPVTLLIRSDGGKGLLRLPGRFAENLPGFGRVPFLETDCRCSATHVFPTMHLPVINPEIGELVVRIRNSIPCQHDSLRRELCVCVCVSKFRNRAC